MYLFYDKIRIWKCRILSNTSSGSTLPLQAMYFLYLVYSLRCRLAVVWQVFFAWFVYESGDYYTTYLFTTSGFFWVPGLSRRNGGIIGPMYGKSGPSYVRKIRTRFSDLFCRIFGLYPHYTTVV